MLESTDLNIQEVQDNIDTYGKYLINTNMTEYAKAYKTELK